MVLRTLHGHLAHYPVLVFFYVHVGCKPEQQMMYAGSKNALVQETGFTKVSIIMDKDDSNGQPSCYDYRQYMYYMYTSLNAHTCSQTSIHSFDY